MGQVIEKKLGISLSSYKFLIDQKQINTHICIGGAKVLPPIIKIGGSLSSTEYEQIIVAAIVKTFAVPDRTIRLSLLENLGTFIDKLSNKIVNDQIFQHVVSTV